MGTRHRQLPSKSRYPAWLAPDSRRDEKVLGYELLFQQDGSEPHATSDMESVAGAIIDTLSLLGLDVLCDGHRAFIDCTHQMLLMEYFALLPPEVVVEIQESVPPITPSLCVPAA